MPLSDDQKQLLKDVYEGIEKRGYPLAKLVEAFESGGIIVTQDSVNYSFRRPDEEVPSLTTSFSKTTTPKMTRLSPKMRELAGDVLFTHDPNFRPDYLDKKERKPIPAPGFSY